MTSSPVTPSLLLVASLLLLLLSPASPSSYSCPRGCECDGSTFTCTSVAGLRSVDKSLPVKRLVLSGLELSKIPPQLENIRNITELDLSNNHLSEVNHLGKRIRQLNLSQNRITSGKLSRIPPFVEALNLTHNDITYLPLHLMKLKKLRSIELANNPINCTCDTLHIRNWLTMRHVWSDQHIKCSAPHEFKGRPWLQVKQADVCQGTGGQTGGYNWDEYEDENDLMLGDQADLGDADEEEEEEDDFKKEYFPVNEKLKSRDPPIDFQNDEEMDDGSGDGSLPDIGEEEKNVAEDVIATSAVEGSGEEKNGTITAVRVGQIQNAVEHGEDNEEGSGSGGGILPFGVVGEGKGSTEDPQTDDDIDEDEASEEKPITPPGTLGIFGKGLEDDTTTRVTTEPAEVIVPFRGGVEATKESGGVADSDAPVAEEEQIIAEEPTRADADSQGTYILLAILGIILVSLIILVMCKRKPQTRNRRNKADMESGRSREMQDMDKSLLGKPLDKNGHNPPERTPLMKDGDNGKPNNYAPAKPERTSLEKPALDSFKPVPADRTKGKDGVYENVPQNNNNNVPLQNGNGNVPPVKNGDPSGIHQPNHEMPAQNGDSLPNGNPNQLQPEPPTNNVESPKTKRYSPIYVPTSPRSDRYSPVYSPETGRVKIKLTETPKPKTPILVTRSRSRAGEYITTPDQKF